METEVPITSIPVNAGFESYDIDALLDAYVVLKKSTLGSDVIMFTFQEAKDRIRSELEKRNPKDLVSYMINDAM
jgi:hypothetical protein